MICHQCLRQSLIANWFMSWCFAVVAFTPYFSREQGGSLSAFLFLNLILIWNKIVDSLLMWLFMTCDVIDGVFALLCFAHFDTIWPVPICSIKGWTGLIELNRHFYPWRLGNMWRTFTNKMWPVLVLQFYFPIFSDQHSDSCNLDSKFCLHAAGGIYVHRNFIHSGGNLSISGSSADWAGAVFGRVWDGCRLWEINSRVWNRKELKRCSWFAINVRDKAWLQIGSCLDVLQLLLSLMWTGDQNGCLSLSLLVNMIMIWLKVVDNLLVWLFVTCDVNDGVFAFRSFDTIWSAGIN